MLAVRSNLLLPSVNQPDAQTAAQAATRDMEEAAAQVVQTHPVLRVIEMVPKGDHIVGPNMPARLDDIL